MKKLFVALIAALALAAVATAQSAPPPPDLDGQAQKAQQLVSLSGKLEVIDGMIGIKDGGTSYIVPRLRALVGFVNELQEGASVRLEGYAFPIPSRVSSLPGYSMLAVTKLTIAGKDYDFSPIFRRGMHGMWGRGRIGMRGGPCDGMGGEMWGGPGL
jgi:hypothetical protein